MYIKYSMWPYVCALFFKTAFFRVCSPTTLFTTMPRPPGTPRPPLGEVSPGTRNRVVGARNHGIAYTAIGEQENLEPSTCRRIFKKAPNQISCIIRPRPGRPTLLTERDQRCIFRTIVINPKITAQQLVATVVPHIKKKTVYRFLKKSGIQKWRCTKRPLLTEEHAAARLAWALKYDGMPLAFWKR